MEREVFEGAKLAPEQVREMGVVEAGKEVLMEKVIFEQEQCCVAEVQ